MQKIESGYKHYKIWEQDIVEVIEFDPTKVSVFLMPMTGSGFFIAAPPEAVHPFDYTGEERKPYESLYTIKRLPV